MELLMILFLGMIFFCGLAAVTAGVFRLFFHAVGCLLVLPVLIVLFVVFTAFASILFVPVLFLAGFILVLAGLIKLVA